MFDESRGKEQIEYKKNYVMFDLETTGLDVNSDRIVEIGAIRIKDYELVDEFSTYVNPECLIPADVIELHGITNEIVKDSPGIKEALHMFNDFIGEDVLIGQNIINFDLQFIWRDCESFLDRTIANDFIDNLTIAKKVLPTLKNHSLARLCNIFGIDQSIKHKAVYDCKRTKKVYDIIGKLYDNSDTDRIRKICRLSNNPTRVVDLW